MLYSVLPEQFEVLSCSTDVSKMIFTELVESLATSSGTEEAISALSYEAAETAGTLTTNKHRNYLHGWIDD
ncbi:hypothetical protein [Pseudomonas sp. Marseille-Q7302]